MPGSPCGGGVGNLQPSSPCAGGFLPPGVDVGFPNGNGNGDSNGNGPPLPYVPICDVKTCLESCRAHFGYDEAACVDNECYCKKTTSPR